MATARTRPPVTGSDHFAWVPDWGSIARTAAALPGTCTIVASNRQFNNELISITIGLPDDYTCTGDGCWWKIDYNSAGTEVTDTTTWTAYVAGNPLRLVE